jgi:hypothetical protein
MDAISQYIDLFITWQTEYAWGSSNVASDLERLRIFALNIFQKKKVERNSHEYLRNIYISNPLRDFIWWKINRFAQFILWCYISHISFAQTYSPDNDANTWERIREDHPLQCFWQSLSNRRTLKVACKVHWIQNQRLFRAMKISVGH